MSNDLGSKFNRVRDIPSSDRRRFSLLNIPKHLFSSALGEAAQRKGVPGPRRL